VVPWLNLRLKFALPAARVHAAHLIIVTQVQGESGPLNDGISGDGVSEVLTEPPGHRDTPDFGDDASVRYLLGMAKVKGKVKILLDIDQVLSTPELHNLDAILH